MTIAASMQNIKVIPEVPRQPDPTKRRYGIKTYSSQVDMKQLMKERLNRDEWSFKCEFASKQYHIVRHKYNPDFGVDDRIELLPNTSSIPVKLPNVKMHLQPDRPPNLARAHDARFENINKEPAIYSKTQKQTTIDFDKKPPRDTAGTLINREAKGPMYISDDSAIKKRTDFSFVDISKQKGPKKDPEIDYTHDELKASQ